LLTNKKPIIKQVYKNLIIRGGKLVIPGKETVVNPDIYIKNGVIEKIGKTEIKDTLMLNLTDTQYISSGFIDLHCHLREPGFTKSETIKTGSLSAIAGGFTYICCMPNTNPAIDNPRIVKFIQTQAEKADHAQVSLIGAVTKNRAGKKLVNLEKMAQAGVVAISDDGAPVSDPEIMRDALLLSKKYNIPVINHCEVLTLSKDGVMNLGLMSTKMGLKGIPDTAESIMVLRDVLLAEQTGGWVHIAHVSCAKSVELISWAKKRGIRITAETCPHYFTLTDKDCLSLNTNFKVSPPLRTKTDVEAIKQGLSDGAIDAIATDHAPWHFSYKQKPWIKAKSGMIGFETAFSLGYQELVMKKYLSLEKYLACLTTKPGQIIHQPVQISKGLQASITIFDISKIWIQTPGNIVSKSKNSPYLGRELKGKVKIVVLNRAILYINC
jgi:dihydroorotase